MDRKAFILENTSIDTPLMCPELSLHLITESCRLWYATESDLKELAIGDPYWGFCWPGGQALARHILDHADLVCGRRVLVFGAGCGIEAIAALKSGAVCVTAADTDPFAAEATALNGLLNGVRVHATTRNYLGENLDDFDVVLAGDMFYDPVFTREVMTWLTGLAGAGKRVLLSDPGRGNLSGSPLRVIAAYRAPVDVDSSGKYLQEALIYEVDPAAGGEGSEHADTPDDALEGAR